MDDDAGLLHRLPMGGGSDWQDNQLHLSGHELLRTLPGRREAGVFAPSRNWTVSHGIAHYNELPWNSDERQLPERDCVWGNRTGAYVHCGRAAAWLRSEFPAVVQRVGANLDPAGAADRSILHDGIRVDRQVFRGGQFGVPVATVSAGDHDSHAGGNWILRYGDRSHFVRCSLAEPGARTLGHSGGFRTVSSAA